MKAATETKEAMSRMSTGISCLLVLHLSLLCLCFVLFSREKIPVWRNRDSAVNEGLPEDQAVKGTIWPSASVTTLSMRSASA